MRPYNPFELVGQWLSSARGLAWRRQRARDFGYHHPAIRWIRETPIPIEDQPTMIPPALPPEIRRATAAYLARLKRAQTLITLDDEREK